MMFETHIAVLPCLNSRITLALKLFLAERMFFLERYSDSKAKLNELLNEKITKRSYLNILFRLAQIDEISDQLSEAAEL